MPTRQLRRRKCRHCGKLFRPHPAVGNRQKFCITEACQKTRKAANNREFAKPNPDYHKGALAVARTNEWRRKNPGYWHRRNPRTGSRDISPDVLQVELHSELTVNEELPAQQRIDALQAELVLMMGQWHDKGAAIGVTLRLLNDAVFITQKGGKNDETKLCVTDRSTPVRTETFQLDRPSTDS
jgi:hypothetical protein